MRIARSSTFVVATLALLSLGGCSKDRPSQTTVTSGTIAPDPEETRQRNEYVRGARGDMDNLGKRIQRLEIFARSLDEGADRVKLEDDLRDVRARFRDLSIRVDAVATMSNESWKNERPRLDADWERLNDRVDAVSAGMTHEIFPR